MKDKNARFLLTQLLSRTQDGQLILEEDGVARTFGSPTGAEPPRAHITVNDPAFHRSLLKGSLGLGESYMDGLWDVDDPVTLIRIAARNVHRFDELRRTFRPLLAPVQTAVSYARRNTIERSREQIAAHYDLGNDLYERGPWPMPPRPRSGSTRRVRGPSPDAETAGTPSARSTPSPRSPDLRPAKPTGVTLPAVA